jgi:tripartite-type tricarboxylate transporter receptor subunit TctC
MQVHRRTFVALGATTLAAPLWAQSSYPSKPIRLVVNFPPGGAADVIGRAVGQQLAEQLKQSVVVDNRAGANGNLGADVVAKAPGDGYTLLMSSGGAFTVNPALYANMPFDAQKDFVPVASAARVLVFLLAHPSVPANDFKSFVAHLKANPGKLSYASAGSGSSPHLAGEMFKQQMGVFAVHIPYRGAAPALTDLLAGQVQYMFDPGPGLRHAREGKLKMLAVGSARRSSVLPELPTLAESGAPGFDADTVFGVYAPAATPAAVVTLLHAEINKALATPKVQEVIRTLGAEVMITSRGEFIERQNKDRERFGSFIKAARISAD